MIGINMDNQQIIDNAVDSLSSELHRRIDSITLIVNPDDRAVLHNSIAVRVHNTVMRKAITEVPDDAGAKILLG